MKGLMFLPFVALTVVSWGLYGPTLHLGQDAFGADGQRSAFRPFICVGLAYFLVAVIVPAVVLRTKGEGGFWTMKGFIWSFAAGAIGAVGALGIILALKFGGDPIYVMPLVFGCAPVVNTLVTMLMAGNFKQASWPFFVGILIVAIGAAGVLVNKPTKPKAEKTAETQMQSELQPQAEMSAPETEVLNATMVAAVTDAKSDKFTDSDRGAFASMVLRTLFILMTALCWGAYGPVLHKGQIVMGGSRLRPFLCVGMAYFVVAVVFPLLIQPAFRAEAGDWYSVQGWFWSFLGGSLGALGALGIIYAFNFGGKPLFVMPLVFGMAPVVNTFSEIISKGLWDHVGWMFFISLFLVIAGAVTVLTTAPKSKPHAPPPVTK